MHEEVKYDVFVNDLLDLVASADLPVAVNFGFIRTHILNSGFPLEFTDEYISGWLGAEAARLAVKYTGLDDEVLDRATLELNELDILRKLKTINENELSCKIVAYLYLFSKLSGYDGPWTKAKTLVDLRYEEVTDAA